LNWNICLLSSQTKHNIVVNMFSLVSVLPTSCNNIGYKHQFIKNLLYYLTACRRANYFISHRFLATRLAFTCAQFPASSRFCDCYDVPTLWNTLQLEYTPVGKHFHRVCVYRPSGIHSHLVEYTLITHTRVCVCVCVCVCVYTDPLEYISIRAVCMDLLARVCIQSKTDWRQSMLAAPPYSLFRKVPWKRVNFI